MRDFKKGERVGSFAIERKISDHGGMSSIYEGSVIDREYPERHGVRVALKFARMNEDNARIYEQLLIRETDMLHDLRHPGIVRLCPISIYGKRLFFARAAELDDDAPWYYAMEFLSGGTLTENHDLFRFSQAWRIELLYQIAVILDYLHIRELGHRDLKPENIMFRERPSQKTLPIPVLIDFGLAEKRRLNPEISAATIGYAAPERIRHIFDFDPGSSPPDALLDHLTGDIWALGIIAYELLAGQYPFGEEKQRTALAHKIVHQIPAPMPQDVPANLQRLILDMLSKEPEQRPGIETVLRRIETEIEIISPRI